MGVIIFVNKSNSDVKIGDYVEYIPDISRIVTNRLNTGRKSAQIFETNLDVRWRVLFVDKQNNRVCLTTEKNVTEIGVYLEGIVGFSKGMEELHSICAALYSSKELAVKARCIMVEDLCKSGLSDYNPVNSHSYFERRAYYSRNNFWIKSIIKFNEEEYTCECVDINNSRFYFADGGGVEKVDENGLKYRTPRIGKPVFMSDNSSSYYFKFSDIFNELFGKSSFGFASQYINTWSSDVEYGIYSACQSEIRMNKMYYSFGRSFDAINGLRPVVVIDLKKLRETNIQMIDGFKVWKMV